MFTTAAFPKMPKEAPSVNFDPVNNCDFPPLGSEQHAPAERNRLSSRGGREGVCMMMFSTYAVQTVVLGEEERKVPLQY